MAVKEITQKTDHPQGGKFKKYKGDSERIIVIDPDKNILHDSEGETNATVATGENNKIYYGKKAEIEAFKISEKLIEKEK